MLFESTVATIALIISVITLIAALLAWNDVLETDREIREMIRECEDDDDTEFWTE